MSFFDEISKSAKSFAEKTAKKAGELTESAKLAISLRAEEAKLEGLYAELGKLRYEKSEEAVIAAQILEIDEEKSVISQIKADIAQNSGKLICSACGKEISSESAFCQFCGAKQEQKKNLSEELAKAQPDVKSAAAETKSDAKAETADSAKCDFKPLSAEEFIEFFKATMLKYNFAK